MKKTITALDYKSKLCLRNYNNIDSFKKNLSNLYMFCNNNKIIFDIGVV
jgi:hypothetical protein